MRILGAAAVLLALSSGIAAAAGCEGYGPQAPRDIGAPGGANPVSFAPAPEAAALRLCNIHGHMPAEHRGPGFLRAVAGGGFACDEALTEAERAPMEGAFEGLAPGDAFEVHWVYSSCPVSPGPGLGACSSASCSNPQLRVEAQVFLIVNDPAAADIRDYDIPAPGATQPKALPGGAPVVYLGSTTGPSYSAETCSPLQVTWSVRPGCAKLHIGSLHAWAEGNVYGEEEAHGVRPLVTEAGLLAPIR